MQNSISKATVIVLLFFLSTSCSKKTTAPSNNETTQRSQEARKQRGERPQFSKLLSEMDGNSDGKLSPTEVKGPLKDSFSKIDANRDGFITETEFKDAHPPQRKRRN